MFCETIDESFRSEEVGINRNCQSLGTCFLSVFEKDLVIGAFISSGPIESRNYVIAFSLFLF